MKNFFFILLLFLPIANRIHSNGSFSNSDALKQHICEVLPTLTGWCSQEKALSFIDLILEVKPKVCVEIGVFGGGSIFPVASTLKFLEAGVIIAIDPWDKQECIKYFDPITEAPHLDWWERVNLDDIFTQYVNMLKTYQLFDYCVTMRTTSEKAAAEIDLIDILHIDGNHSEFSSIDDVSLYLPKVCSGGYIWMDDAISFPKTHAAFRLLQEACDPIKSIDNGNCILFKKR